MIEDPDFNEDEVRDLLSVLDDEQPRVPPAFAEGLLAELDPHPEATQPRLLAWAAAVGVLVLVGVGLLFAAGRGDTAPLASDGSAAEQQREGDPSVAPTTDVPPRSTSSVEPDPVELGFALPLGVTSITHEAVEIQFTSTADTVYNVVVRRNGEPTETTSAQAQAGERVLVEVDRLSSSVRYTVEVVLLGPPSVPSQRLEFVTSPDPDDPNPVIVPIEIRDLAVSDVTSSSATITFSSTHCATASFVVLDPIDQSELSRFDASEATCATTHTLTPGIESAPLPPGTDLLVLVSATAVDEAFESQNVTSTSVDVTTQESNEQ